MGRRKSQVARRRQPPPHPRPRVWAPRTYIFIAALALAVLGTWAYSNSFAGVFVLDDGASIVDNPNIRTLWPLTTAMSAPPGVGVSGRPIASLTFAVSHAISPDEARGYHLLNLVIHVLAALTLFGVVRRTLLSEELRPRYGPIAAPLAFVVAAIWVVHPLNTGSVTYIVQRVESLMGLFYLLSLYGAIRAATDGPRRRWWTAASIASCALGMGTKEVMVTAPIVIWLWDLTFLRASRHRWPLYAGLCATWIILAALVASEPRSESVGFGLGWTWWTYLRTQAGVIIHYLRLAIVPTPLVLDYEWPEARALPHFLPHVVVLGTAGLLTVFGAIRRHPAALPAAWFFLVLAPTSSVLPIVTEVAAEHRMYLPLAAVIALIVVGAYESARRLPESGRRAASILAVAVIILAFGQMTRARNADYHSEERLWRDTIEKRPGNSRAWIGYGIVQMKNGDFGTAESQFRRAIELSADSSHAHMNLGSALAAQGRAAEGIPHLERAIALNPARKETYGLLAQAYADTGRWGSAAKYFTQAVELMPGQPLLLHRAAWLLATSPDPSARDGVRAAAFAEEAVRLTGERDPSALQALAAAYAEQGRFADAAATIGKAIEVARASGDGVHVREMEEQLRQYADRRKL